MDDTCQFLGRIRFSAHQIRPESQGQRRVDLIEKAAPEHDSRRMEAILQKLQHLEPVTSRHVEIQQHEIWKWKCLPIPELIDAAHIRDRLGPIMDKPNHPDRTDMAKLGAQELAFVLRILNDQRSEGARSGSHKKERVLFACFGVLQRVLSLWFQHL
jgi:hypothetical protein